MPRLVIYSKPGCHLCDEMKAVVQRVSARIPLALEVVDISGNPDLESKYALEIPVLLIDGRKAAKYRIDERALEERLRK